MHSFCMRYQHHIVDLEQNHWFTTVEFLYNLHPVEGQLGLEPTSASGRISIEALLPGGARPAWGTLTFGTTMIQ